MFLMMAKSIGKTDVTITNQRITGIEGVSLDSHGLTHHN